MRNSRDKWSFYKLPSREPLSAKEVDYWKNSMKKILKIGLEFEYNLPEKKNGKCRGNSEVCPCVNLTEDNTCWKDCASKNECELMDRSLGLQVCLNVTGTCELEDCASCSHFESRCLGVACSSFITKCLVCDEYTTNCISCEYRYDPSKSPDAIRKGLRDELRPSNAYGQCSRSGVHSIATDGSLKGQKGAEIITIGRRIDYWEFYKMSSNIIESVLKRGGYLNERCSIHMHALASYYGKRTADQHENAHINLREAEANVKELERDMPEIILANLHQLVRRYQNAMTWMMMGLGEQERMTRWEKFRVSVLSTSAVIDHMKIIRDQISDLAGGSKYGWINYNQINFSKNSGDVNRFHVEFRACDGLNSPSAVSAIACMYYALIIKAIEISRYGVVEVGDEEWMERAKDIKKALLNNMKHYTENDRFSDTSNLYKYHDILISESLDLAAQLKSILIKVGPAYEVLEKLAERPCALRRVNGESWEQIESSLKVIVSEEGAFEEALTEILTLNQVFECSGMEEWVNTVNSILLEASEFKKTNGNFTKEINEYIKRKKEEGDLVWSNRIGAPILI